MKHYFIVNPCAGNGSEAEKLCEKINEICAKEGVDFEIYLTRAIGDATDFVRGVCREAKELPVRFYACGGDGTLGEVVNGAYGTDEAEVALIPIGTGNDFARNFSDNENFFDINAQINGSAAKIDLLKCNEQVSVNMVNIGFDCEVVKKKEKLQEHRFLPSKLAYIFGLVITLVKKPGMNARVFADGEEISDSEFLLSTIANGSFCGGGFKSNPHSSVNDGMLDALFIRNVSRTKFVSLVGSYKKGTHIVSKNNKVLFHKKASKLVLKFPKTQSICIDGEICECEELTLECIHSALSFSIPRGSAIINSAKGSEVLV